MGTGADTFPILIPSGQLESPALLWGTSPKGLLDLGAITFSEDEVPVSGLGALTVQLSLGQPCGPDAHHGLGLRHVHVLSAPVPLQPPTPTPAADDIVRLHHPELTDTAPVPSCGPHPPVPNSVANMTFLVVLLGQTSQGPSRAHSQGLALPSGPQALSSLAAGGTEVLHLPVCPDVPPPRLPLRASPPGPFPRGPSGMLAHTPGCLPLSLQCFPRGPCFPGGQWSRALGSWLRQSLWPSGCSPWAPPGCPAPSPEAWMVPSGGVWLCFVCSRAGSVERLQPRAGQSWPLQAMGGWEGSVSGLVPPRVGCGAQVVGARVPALMLTDPPHPAPRAGA